MSEWLRDLGLDVHVSAFADARVDGRLLLKLNLLELGVTSKLQRKLICRAARRFVRARGELCRATRRAWRGLRFFDRRAESN